MNVEGALATANFSTHAEETSEPRVLLAACILADEVDRLRSELLKANADTERLEGELAEARRQPVQSLDDLLTPADKDDLSYHLAEIATIRRRAEGSAANLPMA